MSSGELRAGRRILERDGRPFLLLADTAWSAFVDAEEDEWAAYVRQRAGQGFTGVMVSALPVLHDRSVGPRARTPLPEHADGTLGWDAPDREYLARAARMAEAARAAGLQPVIVVLWCNYVPGTWAARRDPAKVLPLAGVDGWVRRVAEAFAPSRPILLLAGDSDCATPETVAHHAEALAAARRWAPWALTGLHLAPQATLPPELAGRPELDLLTFQSGHHADGQARAHELAAHYAGVPGERPVLNLEPCYEGHGRVGGEGRFGRAEVRAATWAGLLSGAGAGMGYGAHGVWQWHRPGEEFTSAAASLEPFAREDALRFAGAGDVAFARELVEAHALHGAIPRQDLLVAGPAAVRVAVGEDLSRIALHLPWAAEVALAVPDRGYEAVGWDLETRRPWRPRVTQAAPGRLALAAPPHNADSLVVLRRA